MHSVIAGMLRSLRNAQGEDCLYRRDGVEVPVKALIGESKFQIESQTGQLMTVVTTDFLIGVDELAEIEDFSVPKRGDRIVRCEMDGLPEFEVNAPSGSDCYRFSDVLRTQVRTHTEEVAKS